MGRKSKSNHIAITLLAIIGLAAIVAVIAFLHPTVFDDEEGYDSKWPYSDLTSGDYSGGYDGIDISRHQGLIHWDEVAKNKHLKFIYVKATEGFTHRDPCYKQNIAEARRHGFLVGSYHFMTKGSTGTMQFSNFNRFVDRYAQDLRPMIDCEDDGTLGWDREEIQSHLMGWVRACKKAYGVAPIIYCSESYYKDYLAPEFDNYLLFIANYSGRPVLPGKPKYDVWQFSKKGRIPGVWNWVDLDKLADGVSVDDLKL